MKIPVEELQQYILEILGKKKRADEESRERAAEELRLFRDKHGRVGVEVMTEFVRELRLKVPS